jgi:hypothetical protein
MSALGAIIASATALFIAIIVYPWQKSLDRANEIEKERRALTARVYDALGDSRDWREDSRNSEVLFSRLGGQAAALGMQTLSNALFELSFTLNRTRSMPPNDALPLLQDAAKSVSDQVLSHSYAPPVASVTLLRWITEQHLMKKNK